jgi:hypothetical protein
MNHFMKSINRILATLLVLTVLIACKKEEKKEPEPTTPTPTPVNLREEVVGTYIGVTVINSGIERLAPGKFRVEAADDNRFRLIDEDSTIITLLTAPSLVDKDILSADIPTQQITIRNITYDFFGEGNHMRYNHANKSIRIQYKAQRPGFMSGTTISFGGNKQ